MKERGATEPQIMQILRQEGITPKEIEEVISQSKIKAVVDGESNAQESSQTSYGGGMNMEKSIMSNENSEYQTSSEQTSEYASEAAQEQTQAAPMPTAEYYPQYQEQEQQYSEYQPQQSLDIETITEVIEQSIDEKNEGLKKQIASFTRFKEDTSLEIEKINSRLTKLETVFNDLQTAIIKKIGTYGEDIHTIAKEMRTTQDTFSKIIDPLTDNIRELREITGNMKPQEQEVAQSQEEESQRPQKRQKSDFESFLR